jgi:hypothetical protein
VIVGSEIIRRENGADDDQRVGGMRGANTQAAGCSRLPYKNKGRIAPAFCFCIQSAITPACRGTA